MKRFNPVNILLTTLLGLTVWSCNSSTEEYFIPSVDYSNMAVTSFSLGKNDNILANLDTIFFPIDLNNARIFNADSLPVGTVLTKTVMNISLPMVSKATLYFNGDEGRDSVNYLTNSSDSVNLGNGPVTLSVVSYDGASKIDYTITVNIHKSVPDTLEWGGTAYRDLPTTVAHPTAVRTVEWQNRYYCLTTDGTDAVMGVASEPAQEEWDYTRVTLPAGADVRSLTATGDALYILAGDGSLYRSGDAGLTWGNTGARMSHIYGNYDGKLVGNLLSGNDYVQIVYPDATDPASATRLPDGCPVSGTSNPLTYTTEWSDYPMMMVTGGVDARGKCIGSSWAFDGSQWAAISVDAGLPRSGMSVFPYYTFRTNEYWVVTRQSVLFVIGGKTDAGKNDNTVYLSRDRGVHWYKAPANLQIPEYVTPFADADAFVSSSLLSSRSRSVWHELEPAGKLLSRATQPVTSWECPYIYVFGGNNSEGALVDKVWRGVINRLTFKPIH
ncbi:MAG: hypothetical protein J6C91_04175 [Muribaculaceae bacterium]|nr:hypothetical protein [Muribaculaceae bacterium]